MMGLRYSLSLYESMGVKRLTAIFILSPKVGTIKSVSPASHPDGVARLLIMTGKS